MDSQCCNLKDFNTTLYKGPNHRRRCPIKSSPLEENQKTPFGTTTKRTSTLLPQALILVRDLCDAHVPSNFLHQWACTHTYMCTYVLAIDFRWHGCSQRPLVPRTYTHSHTYRLSPSNGTQAGGLVGMARNICFTIPAHVHTHTNTLRPEIATDLPIVTTEKGTPPPSLNGTAADSSVGGALLRRKSKSGKRGLASLSGRNVFGERNRRSSRGRRVNDADE